MADHLMEQTLPVDKAELAQYYQRGMAPAFAGDLTRDTLTAEASELLRKGIPPESLASVLATSVELKHAEFVRGYLSEGMHEAAPTAALARLAEYVAVGGMAPSEAEERLTETIDRQIFDLEHRLGQAERFGLAEATEDARDWQTELANLEVKRARIVQAWDDALGAASYRFDKIVQTAEAGIHGHTVAEPRRDMHPKLAELLGMDMLRPPTRDEIANLLNGQRADGEDIPGKQLQRATVGLDEALGLNPKRAPTWDEVSQVLAGRRADGKSVEGPATVTARSRFLALMGAQGGREPTDDQVRRMLAGQRADGTEIDLATYERGVTASKARIGYIDLTFSADKSLSVAWAFAPTEAERNILAQAHRDAVSSAMEFVAAEIGHVRKGKAGKHGTEPGHVGWIRFDAISRTVLAS
jgi:hypothetical protein